MRPTEHYGSATTSVIVVQRERFSMTRESLESLLANTDRPFELIYVDAGSPNGIRRYLEQRSGQDGFRVMRLPYHVSPVVARNLGYRASRGKYVVFADNDVLFSKGWLQRLASCAEETRADVVTPLVCYGDP